MNKTRCIITSASSKFFPSLINLLGSIHKNYPNHPDVYVYDIGLFYTFRKELEGIPWVHVLKIPHFVAHWRSCYTWKTYIFNTPLADLNLYLDAGNQVLKPLDDIFNKIDKNGYLIVSAGHEVKNQDIIPEEYINIFNMDITKLNDGIITAGIFGFNATNSKILHLTQKLFACGKEGLCLGYSPTEQWKNKGVNKNIFIRNAKYFRHDNTLLCILISISIPDAKIEDAMLFNWQLTGSASQYIWNLRLNYKTLQYTALNQFSTPRTLISLINKICLKIFLLLKEINRYIKNNHY